MKHKLHFWVQCIFHFEISWLSSIPVYGDTCISYGNLIYYICVLEDDDLTPREWSYSYDKTDKQTKTHQLWFLSQQMKNQRPSNSTNINVTGLPDGRLDFSCAVRFILLEQVSISLQKTLHTYVITPSIHIWDMLIYQSTVNKASDTTTVNTHMSSDWGSEKHVLFLHETGRSVGRCASEML